MGVWAGGWVEVCDNGVEVILSVDFIPGDGGVMKGATPSHPTNASLLSRIVSTYILSFSSLSLCTALLYLPLYLPHSLPLSPLRVSLRSVITNIIYPSLCSWSPSFPLPVCQCVLVLTYATRGSDAVNHWVLKSSHTHALIWERFTWERDLSTCPSLSPSPVHAGHMDTVHVTPASICLHFTLKSCKMIGVLKQI